MQCSFTNEIRLRDYLKSKGGGADNRKIIPRLTGTDPLAVNFSLSIVQILSLNEKMQYIEILVWKRSVWWDKIHSWEPKEYGGIEEIAVSPADIWVPQIFLYTG